MSSSSRFIITARCNALSLYLLLWCTSVCLMRRLQSVQNAAARLISKPDDVCALLRRHHSLFAALVGPPSAIEHSRSPAPVFGTVCHSTLRLHPHCLSFAAASRLTSLGFRLLLTNSLTYKFLMFTLPSFIINCT